MFAEGSHQRGCCQEGVRWQSETAQDGCATAQGLTLFFEQKTASPGAKTCHKCGAVNLPRCPSLLGPQSPPQTTRQSPPQLGCLLPKNTPSSFSLSGKESTAHPRGNRSPTPWPEIPQSCSRVCCCLHSADIPGCAGDQWHLGQFLLSCKCRRECFVLLSSLYAEDCSPAGV